MKKLSLIFFLVVYTFSNIGFGMYQHFCGEELISQSVFKSNIKSCCSNDDEKETSDDGCCKTKYSFVKIKDVQKTSLAEKLQKLKQNYFLLNSHAILSSKHTLLSNTDLIFHPPPNNLGTTIYLRNCVLII